MKIIYSVIVFEEEVQFVAYSPQLDLSSCGNTPEEARAMLRKAIKLFSEETEKMKTAKREEAIITNKRKPVALLRSFSEDDIEEYILNHPKFLKHLDELSIEREESGKKFSNLIKKKGLKKGFKANFKKFLISKYSP